MHLSTREHGWRMCSANCLTGRATPRTSRDSFPVPGQRKTKSLPSSTNQVRLEPTLYNLELVGPNSNILCSNQYGIYRMLTSKALSYKDERQIPFFGFIRSSSLYDHGITWLATSSSGISMPERAHLKS